MLCLAAALMLAAAPAHAQQRFELGASVINLSFIVDDSDDNVVVLGVPNVGFGLMNPGVYASIFAGTRVSVEPQLSLTWLRGDGESTHLINAAIQANYFPRGSERTSPYVFATVGGFFVDDAPTTPVTFGGGIGYRWRLGDRLVMRLDGRYLRISDDDFDSNSVAVTLWLGGLFGGR
jgi:hypothetical protein